MHAASIRRSAQRLPLWDANKTGHQPSTWPLLGTSRADSLQETNGPDSRLRSPAALKQGYLELVLLGSIPSVFQTSSSFPPSGNGSDDLARHWTCRETARSKSRLVSGEAKSRWSYGVRATCVASKDWKPQLTLASGCGNSYEVQLKRPRSRRLERNRRQTLKPI